MLSQWQPEADEHSTRSQQQIRRVTRLDSRQYPNSDNLIYCAIDTPDLDSATTIPTNDPAAKR